MAGTGAMVGGIPDGMAVMESEGTGPVGELCVKLGVAGGGYGLLS